MSYLRRVYQTLTVISVIIAILVFVTGKSSLTENTQIIFKYLRLNYGPAEKKTVSENAPITFNEERDNLVTTLCKTFFVFLAIIFLVLGALISLVLESIIYIVSFGDYSFYCTKEIWNLCWNKIFTNWYWVPSKSVYLWISFLLFSSLFNSQAKK